jgi:hypothetical protein
MSKLDDRFMIGRGGGFPFEDDIHISLDRSLHAAVAYRPVDVTLTTTDVVQDVLNLASLPTYTVNTVTNPSFEHGTPATGWTADASTLGTGSNQRSGTNSLSITPNNAAVGEGAYYVIDDAGSSGNEGTWVVASLYARRATGSGSDVRIEITNAAGVSVANGNTITLTTSPQRSVAYYLIPLGTSIASYRIYARTVTQHATAIEIDDVQVEYRTDGQVTPFCWGEGGIDNKWIGTANASASARVTPISIVRGFSFKITGGDALIALDYDALQSFTAVETGATTTSVLILSTESWTTDMAINVTKKISFVNRTGTDTPRIQGWVWGLI